MSSNNRRATIATTKPSSLSSSSLDTQHQPSSSSSSRKRSSYVGHQFKLVKMALGLKKQASSDDLNAITDTTTTITNNNTAIATTTTNNINSSSSSIQENTINLYNNDNDTYKITAPDNDRKYTESSSSILPSPPSPPSPLSSSLHYNQSEELQDIKVSAEEIELLRAELMIKEKLINETHDDIKALKNSMSNQINTIDTIKNIPLLSNDENYDEDNLRNLREKLNNIRSKKEKVIDPLREEAIALNEALTDTRNNITIIKEKLIESEKIENNLKSFYGTLCGIFSEAQSDLNNIKNDIKNSMISDPRKKSNSNSNSNKVDSTEQKKSGGFQACFVEMRIV